MNLAEKLAEKKRLAALAATETPTKDDDQKPTVNSTEQQQTEQQTEIVKQTAVVQTDIPTVVATVTQPSAASVAIVEKKVEEKKVEEVLTDANGRPLSGFALVKARKERALLEAKAATNSPPPMAPAVSAVAVSTITEEKKTIEPAATSMSAETAVGGDVPFQSLDTQIEAEDSEAYDAATPETQQAYSDIKLKLSSLVSSSGEDLKNEMQSLKKALMQNPNAVALMLPSDIGQMVIALRKMTGVELAAAKSEKSSTAKKKKEVALSAEQLEEAWNEL